MKVNEENVTARCGFGDFRAQEKSRASMFGVQSAFLSRESSRLIELFYEIEDLIDLIYLIDMVNLIDSVILTA